MPSMMIHLLSAQLVRPGADSLFNIGTVAPDAVNTREEKDITHFRVHKDREGALSALAAATDPADSFGEGVLLHLFLDMCWDSEAFCRYSREHNEQDWFLSYRREIALAGSYIFNHSRWSGGVWEDMLSCPRSKYGAAPGVSAEELEEFLKRNYLWHRENNIGPSRFYSPEYVNDFAARSAEKYLKWRGEIAISPHGRMA